MKLSYLAYDFAKALVVKTAVRIVNDHYNKMIERDSREEGFDPDTIVSIGIKRLGDGDYAHMLDIEGEIDYDEVLNALAQSMITFWLDNFSEKIPREGLTQFFEEKLNIAMDKHNNKMFH